MNLVSAIFALMMVTIAQRPADDDHPYGHHKAEYFSSGFGRILIVAIAIAIAIVWVATSRLLEPQPMQALGRGLVLSVLSSALNGLLARVMFSAAKVHRSIALNILWEGGHLMWRSSQGLMDEAVEPDVLREIQKTLAAFDQHTIRFDHVITRCCGADQCGAGLDERGARAACHHPVAAQRCRSA